VSLLHVPSAARATLQRLALALRLSLRRRRASHPETPPRCSDCRYYQPREWGSLCHHPACAIEDPITVEGRARWACNARLLDSHCGAAGRYHEPRRTDAVRRTR
jgi:hypothetical protein